jgi:hypothetical protein
MLKVAAWCQSMKSMNIQILFGKLLGFDLGLHECWAGIYFSDTLWIWFSQKNLQKGFDFHF